MDSSDVIRIFKKNHLPIGRFLAETQKEHHQKEPDRFAFINCRIATQSHGVVWWGDVYIPFERYKLEDICDEVGEPLYLITEVDFNKVKSKDTSDKLIEKATLIIHHEIQKSG